MRKILSSLFIVSAVLVSVAFGANAWLNDTEESTGNAFTVGTIDIAVDGENPWESTGEYVMNDMKPSYTNYINLVVKNVGNNPANVWKTLDNFKLTDETTNEPECDAEDGTWGVNGCDGEVKVSNIDSVINYDMRVELYPKGSETAVWWETIYMDSDNVTLSEINGDDMYLGMIPAGWTMKVYQSYHMTDVDGVDENLYQGDGMTFDITLFAEQLTNTITLENKYEANTNVSHHLWDGKYATFSYKVMDDELNGEVKTYGVSDGTYTLVAWEDASLLWDWGDRGDAIVLANVTVSGNSTVAVGVNLDQDLTEAKVWLVPGNLGTPGSNATPWDWNSTYVGTYFETGLIDYYDSSL